MNSLPGFFILLLFLPLLGAILTSVHGAEDDQAHTGSRTVNGYRGIWFALGHKYEYGDRYSGGLGTYTAYHQPMAVYCPQVRKTFFTYGGTPSADSRHLLIMAACYDHDTGEVSVPVVVYDKNGVDDPHDNGVIQVDDAGTIWCFVSGRSSIRPGFVYRSQRPWSLEGFDCVAEMEMAYPQPWWMPGKGFFFLFTKYVQGERGPARELWWKTSPDGLNWSEDYKLSGFQGHYQVSGLHNGRIATCFNWHPRSANNERTNLYYAETADGGKTWTSVNGTLLALPLDGPENPTLVIDYYAQGQLVYPCDLNFDAEGHPVILYVRSRDGNPGPQGDPREWALTRWNGTEWETTVVTVSTHNYDMGSLYISGDDWKIIGPTTPGPQSLGTGGEIALWESADAGRTWTESKRLTRDSERNHSFVRRPVNAADPFFAFWADGDADRLSPSHLYFCDSEGETVTELPYDMNGSPMQVRPVNEKP